MDIVYLFFSLIGAVSLWYWFIRWKFGCKQQPDEQHFVKSPTGYLAISRYRSRHSNNRNYPVLLCPGLGSNSTSYDMSDDTSLARYLALNGFDVWVADLRGNGRSDRPGFFGYRLYTWNFDDYIDSDIPILLETICERTGRTQVHFIGHSLGGMLLYGVASDKVATMIRSGIALASALDFCGHDSSFRSIRILLKIKDYLPRVVPLGVMTTLLAPLLSWSTNPIRGFFFAPNNARPEIIRTMFASVFNGIPKALLVQLAGIFNPKGIRTADEKMTYLEKISQTDLAFFCVAGDHDLQCPPSAVENTFRLLGSSDKKYRCFGLSSGDKAHYGHADLILGSYAPNEVFPELFAWLIDHDQQEILEDQHKGRTTGMPDPIPEKLETIPCSMS